MGALHLEEETHSGGGGGGGGGGREDRENIQQQLGTSVNYRKASSNNNSSKEEAVSRVCMSSPTAMTKSSAPAKQLTIFYDGTVSVYEAIPPEKVQAILLIASATAASTVTGTAVGPALRRCVTSLRSSSVVAANGATPQPQLVAFNSSSLFCQLQAELPMARRHSLQRFLQKRKDRLVTKGAYASAKSSDGMEEASKGSAQVA